MPRPVNNRWMGDVKLPDGRRFRKMFDTKEEALSFEADPTSESIKPTIQYVFRRAYSMYWQRSKNSVDAYRIVEELITRLGPDRLVKDITTKVVQDLKLDLIQKGNSGARINRKMVTLRKCLKYAVDQEWLANLPKFEREEEGQGRERFLSEREADKLISNLSSPYREFATFLLQTGARYGEAKALRWEDISPNAVTFRWSTTKGKRTRVLPLSASASAALRAFTGQEMPFQNVSYDEWNRRFAAAKKAAGITDPEVVGHTLRHTCASWLVQRGVDIRRVQKWLGHSSVKTTEKYAKLLASDLSSLADVLDTGPANSQTDFSPLALPNGCHTAKGYGNHFGGADKFFLRDQQLALPGECPERQRGRTVNPSDE